jgi:hypothetical protein
MLLVAGLLDQLSECISKYMEEQDLDESESEQDTQQAIEDVQPPRTESQAQVAIAHERHTPPPVARSPEPRNDQDLQQTRTENQGQVAAAHEGHTPRPVARTHTPRDRAQRNATLPSSGATQGQPSQQQAYIQGYMRFTNCGEVNIGSNVAQSGGVLPSGGTPLIAGDLVFEGCQVVNILTHTGPMPSTQRRQRPSHKPTRRPERLTRRRPQTQPQSPRTHQYQAPSQHLPPVPNFGQPTQPNAPLRTFAQPYPPPQPPTQPQSYGSTLQFHTHDPHHSQAYQAGSTQTQGHAQLQPQSWPQTHDPHYSQVYQAGPTQTQVTAQSQPQQWRQTNIHIPPQTQAQNFHGLSQHVQQVASGVYPQAYSHPPQANHGVQNSTRRDEPMMTLEESRRWERQAVDETREIARDRYGERDDHVEGDDENEEFEECEEDEDDELYV